MSVSQWTNDDGLTDVTSAFKGFTQPLHELIDDIHRRGWTVARVSVKDGAFLAEGKSPHGDKLQATGRTDATAVANLLIKVMRREFMRGSSARAKLGAWDHVPIEQQFNDIAMAYGGAPVYDPKAAPAWMDLAQDCGRRALTIRQQVAVEYTDDPVPYENADELREDVTKKRHVFVTRAYSTHPVWSTQQMVDYRLVVDVLGHTVSGGDWGWHGTCMAFAALAPLLGDLPQKALFTELLGQAAFGAFYRTWGPQKIVFLEELIDKEQAKENGSGHHPVHPSQSIVPMQLPSVFTKVASHSLEWFPGKPGKGWVTPEGSILSWNVGRSGAPHHWEQFRDAGLDPATLPSVTPDASSWAPRPGAAVPFNISPEGEVVAQGTGAPLSPDVMSHLRAVSSEFTAPSLRRRANVDPNASWESGVTPMPDNAYLWQRDENGLDPLNIHDTLDQFHTLEPGVSNMHPQMAKQAVINALRSSLLGSRSNDRDHAIHYQDLMNIPAAVDDPMAYMDALEGQRERWNQAQGYAPGSHKQFWAQEQQLKQWIKAQNPQLHDGDVARAAKREVMHMLIEEEERVLAQDQGEQLPAEVIQHEAYEALKKRLKGLTKGNVDQKVDFGEDHLYHEAASPQVMYHGSYGTWDQPQIPATSDDDKEIGRLAGFYTSTDPEDARRFGPNLSTHRMALANPLHVHNPGAGDPGMETWAALTGQPLPEQPVDIADAVRQAGYDGVVVHHPDGRQWHVALQPQAISKTATHHADMYPPYLTSRLRPMAQISRHADQLADAAREDLLSHKGHGHHFRATALNLGIPGLGPRQVSHAWMHLAPQTSQLGVLEPQLEEALGHDYADQTNRDYFKHERELAAGRDSAGYGHVPLGPFSAALYDLKSHGPGVHPDRTVFKPYGPSPHQTVDWNAQQPTYPDWGDPYWWQSTQPARDQAAQDFDRNVAVNFSRDEVPFQKQAANGVEPPPVCPTCGGQMDYSLDMSGRYEDGYAHCPRCQKNIKINSDEPISQMIYREQIIPDVLRDTRSAPWGDVTPPRQGRTAMQWDDGGNILPVYDLKPGEKRYPWITHPTTGERVTGAPGTSIMQHAMTTFGHQDPREVWEAEYEAGKGAGTIAKMAMAERSGFPELDQAIEEFMQSDPEIATLRDPQLAWGRCQEIAEQCAAFLKERGFRAYAPSDEVGMFPGYQDAQDTAAIGAGDFSYPEHAVVEVYGLYGPNNVNNVTIDFTASQYGFTDFPKVEGGRPLPQGGTTAKVAGLDQEWQPGSYGKGVVTPEGDVRHWVVNQHTGQPNHDTATKLMGLPPIGGGRGPEVDGLRGPHGMAFGIEPDGRLFLSGGDQSLWPAALNTHSAWYRENLGTVAKVADWNPSANTVRSWYDPQAVKPFGEHSPEVQAALQRYEEDAALDAGDWDGEETTRPQIPPQTPFGYARVPMSDFTTALLARLRAEGDTWDDWDAYHRSYASNPDMPNHGSSRWPVLTDPNLVVDDGFHRLHDYYRQGDQEVPIVWAGSRED